MVVGLYVGSHVRNAASPSHQSRTSLPTSALSSIPSLYASAVLGGGLCSRLVRDHVFAALHYHWDGARLRPVRLSGNSSAAATSSVSASASSAPAPLQAQLQDQGTGAYGWSEPASGSEGSSSHGGGGSSGGGGSGGGVLTLADSNVQVGWMAHVPAERGASRAVCRFGMRQQCTPCVYACMCISRLTLDSPTITHALALPLPPPRTLRVGGHSGAQGRGRHLPLSSGAQVRLRGAGALPVMHRGTGAPGLITLAECGMLQALYGWNV